MSKAQKQSAHEFVAQNMREMAEKFVALGVSLQLPPNSGLTLGTHYIDIDFGKSLTAEIKFDDRFTNPMHMFQGGFLCAVLDEVYGPLTYMAAGRPVMTIEMSTSFVRPFTAKDESIVVRAEVVNQSKTLMILRAEVRSKSGKLIATSTNHSLISNDSTLRS